MYVRLWEGRGPLVLVLCVTPFDFAVSFFGPEIARLRASGHSVVAGDCMNPTRLLVGALLVVPSKWLSST